MKNSAIKLLLILISSLPLFSNGQSLNLQYFGTENGIPQSTINSILQDRSGNLWIGTLGGVCRYDGHGFTTFSKKNGLAENWVTSSCIDKAGNVWLGHWAGGISRYSAAKDSFQIVTPKNITISKQISCILEDASGVMWFATESDGLLKYTPSSEKDKDGKFEQLTTREGLGSNSVLSILQGKNGKLYIGTEAGLSVYDGNAFKNYSNTNQFSAIQVKSILDDESGNIWLGTQESGVFVYSISQLESNANPTPLAVFNLEKGLKSNSVNTIYKDKKSRIWIGTFGGGLAKAELNGQVGGIAKYITVDDGLSSDKVISILEDREGNLWFGTYIGLNQFRDERFKTYGINEGLDHSLVWSISDYSGAILYLGTEGGLMRFNTTATTNATRFTNLTTGKGLKENNITSVYNDHLGRIWFSAWGEGFGYLDEKSGKIQMYGEKEGINSNILSITSDKKGNIWLGSAKNGAYCFDRATSQFKNYTTKDGLSSDRIYTVFSDQGGDLWFGTLGGYVSRYNGTSFSSYGKKDGLNHNFILSIVQDNAGHLWFGTYGGGIYQFSNNTFSNLNFQDGMNSDTPFLLAPDGDNLWVGTSLGIDKLEISKNKFNHYGRDEGFMGIEINPNAVNSDNKGNIWFGTIAGVVKYDSKSDNSNTTEALLRLDKVMINFQKVKIDQLTHSDQFDAILNYHQNNIAFEFVGVSLTNPKKVHYKYKLDGYDKDWVPETVNNSVIYQNLPAGSYTLLVVSCNNDGLWNKEPLSFKFIIQPPFWKTKWFMAAIVLLVLLLIYLGFRIRTRAILKEKRILEQKVIQRTELLAQKNKDITDSILYAKRIQDAILPLKNEVQKDIPEFFILFKPRDIVSGDFYWFYKKSGKVIIAAVDCTGHGVPGALMSMIGNELLKQIVSVNGVTEPGIILSMLNSSIRTALKQDQSDAQTRDGMDVAICLYDPTSGDLQFAGANRPLYILKKEHADITVINGDKFSIGGIQKETNLTFVTNSAKLEKGDSFYIFTDGYMDQFGGDNDKKFLARRFRATLTSMRSKGMKDQEMHLAQTIQEWQKDKEQVDDILVIGIKH